MTNSTSNTFDEELAEKYRNNDEQVIRFGSRKHYCEKLVEITASFDGNISVLDVGCGTGRYFHCVKGVKHITGMDISSDMLTHARNPVNSDEIEAVKIDLLCGDIYSLELKTESYDFIYSIGVFGEYAPLDIKLLTMMHGLIRPGGQLFITAVDSLSRLQSRVNTKPGYNYRIFRKLFPFFPQTAKEHTNKILGSCYLREHKLMTTMENSPFDTFEISHYVHTSGWLGTHLDCIAHKNG